MPVIPRIEKSIKFYPNVFLKYINAYSNYNVTIVRCHPNK